MRKTKNQLENTILQEKCIDILLLGKSISEVSRELNITRNTIYDWKKDVNFVSELNKRQRELREVIKYDFLSLNKDAIETIKKSLQSKNETLRLKSAIFILDKIDTIDIGSDNIDQLKHDERMNSFLF